jgi:XTP/dITP diphosphohydrolase
VATGSPHKLDELRELLDLPRIDLLSLADLGLAGDAPEDGDTFEENARFKSLWYARLSGLPTIADDSGLEVDALDGRPGVRTRRFAGDDASDEQNNSHMLSVLDEVPPERRTARYRCVLAYAEPNEVLEVTNGTLEGRIALEARGEGGFGYDPIFEPADEPVGGRTVGQLTPAQKNAISHRAEAAREMRRRLLRLGY